MKPTKTALALIFAGALMYWIATFRPAPDMSVKNEASPSLSLPDLAGKTVTLADFKGKAVLIDFWATWCDPCLAELPDLKEVHNKYKDRGFVLLGVSVDEDGPEAVATFARENSVPYTLLWAGAKRVPGWDVPGVPTAFLIRPDGTLVRKFYGPKHKTTLGWEIEKILP